LNQGINENLPYNKKRTSYFLKKNFVIKMKWTIYLQTTN